MLEAVRAWKGSPLYREASARVQTENEQVTLAPWLRDSEQEDPQSPIATRWFAESDSYEGKSFTDSATAKDQDEISQYIRYVAESDEAVEAVLDLLDENERKILFIGRAGETDAFAIQYNEGRYFVAELELEEAFLDEGLISMTLLASTVPDGAAPVVPGFAPIEQKLYETLHAAELLASTLTESEDDASELIETINQFAEDLTRVMVEVMSDQGSLSGRELDLVVETFLGVYAGLHEEALKYTA